MEKREFYKKINYPTDVRKQKNAVGALSLVGKDGELTLSSGGFVVFDMGAESVGGYPVFQVKAFKGNPSVRVSYSDRMSVYNHEETMEKGDFIRNSCGYLGIELPVMPANPDRFENYRIARTGIYSYPLVQGQQRFIYVGLPASENGEDCEVTFSRFYIYDNSAEVVPQGYFGSDDETLDRLWLACARTIRIATICSRQWEKVEGRIALRKLAKSDEGAVYKNTDCKTLRMEAEAEIYSNPAFTSGVGFLVFSDGKKGYKLSLTQDGEVVLRFDSVVLESVKTRFKGENEIRKIAVFANGKGITFSIDGEVVMNHVGKIRTGGSFGFFEEKEWRASLLSVKAVCDGKKVDGAFEPENYNIKSIDYFISDGAKRDRLPWTGDLYWTIDGAAYAFGTDLDPKNTFDVLARHQNDKGFIFGTCYPENGKKPDGNDYGYYQSDAFSVWFVISVLYYAEISGDKSVIRYYPTMKKCMEYVLEYVDKKDGLFYQRFETSKGLWDHELGDVGKNTYTNLLVCDAFLRLAPFAERAGEKKYASKCIAVYKKMRKAIYRRLYDKKAGGFIKKKNSSELCDMANPYAMASGFATVGAAKKIAAKAMSVTKGYGKMVTLMVRGLFDYGYPEIAEKLLFGKVPYLDADGKQVSQVDWLSAIGNPDSPETVYECMHYPLVDSGDNLNWGDLSHPDSVVNGIMSAYIAGIKNVGEGFEKILVRPWLGRAKRIRCGVPTKYGLIEIFAERTAEGTVVRVRVPKGTLIKTDFSELPKPVKYTATYY